MLSNLAEEIKKAVKETRTDDIGDLLKKYDDKSERDFIQKYAETEIAVFSKNVTILSYLFACAAICALTPLNILLALYPDNYKQTYGDLILPLILLFLIIFIPLIILIYYKLFFGKKSDTLEQIILEIEDADKLTMQKQIDSLIVINPIAMENIKNLVKVKKEDGYRFKRYGEYPIAVIIGETHHETPDQLELQKIIIKTLNPGYIISERSASDLKSQTLQKNRNITGKACFVGLISSSEKTQADIITSCSEVCTRPIVAIIGHYHASEMSKIHEFLELWNVDYICIWNEEEAKKVREKHEKVD